MRTDGRTHVPTDGRTDVRTDGHVTITSQPKFLGLIGYQEGVMNLGLGTVGYHISLTELNNALRMFVTSVLSSTLVPRAAILSASATDRSSGCGKFANESVSC